MHFASPSPTARLHRIAFEITQFKFTEQRQDAAGALDRDDENGELEERNNAYLAYK